MFDGRLIRKLGLHGDNPVKNPASALLLGLLLIAAPVQAQRAAKAAAAINDGLSRIEVISKQISQIDDVTFPQLKTKKQNLDDVSELLHGDDVRMKAKRADLALRNADQDSALARHNANQCKGTTAQDCASYDAEAERLDAASAALEKEGADLDTYQRGLSERHDQLAGDLVVWTAAVK